MVLKNPPKNKPNPKIPQPNTPDAPPPPPQKKIPNHKPTTKPTSDLDKAIG